MYRKIVIAADGSEIGGRAATRGLELARRLGASAVAVHVVDTRTLTGATPLVHGSMAPRYAALLEALRGTGEEIVGEVAAEGKRLGVAVETTVLQGPPAVGIIEEAKRVGADLIVMGTHGRSAVGALVLGSTTHAVLHGASVPVLLVR